MIQAYHLPALPGIATTVERFGKGDGAVELALPLLTPELVARQAEALRQERDALAARPARELAALLGGVAERFLSEGDALREAALSALPAVAGYSPEMARLVLDGMAAQWRGERLLDLLGREFGDAAVLDGFVRLGGRRVLAVAPALTVQLFAGNVPGVTVTALVRSLLVKSPVLGKAASGEPLLPALFARALAEQDAALGRALAVAWWRGGNQYLERAALERAEAVVAYGSNDSVGSLRRRAPPGARFIGYGHKFSFGVVARERATSAAARAAAIDVATFDQRGCVSPQLIYVEEGGAASPREWAGLLASELAKLEPRLPRGPLSPGEASALRELRAETDFAGLSEGGARLFEPARGTGWLVIFDPDPAPAPSCLNRAVRVKPVSSLGEVPDLVARAAPLLQTVGVAAPECRVEELAVRLAVFGASRVCPLGQMSWPPPEWHHDGLPPLRSLVRWCDWEYS